MCVVVCGAAGGAGVWEGIQGVVGVGVVRVVCVLVVSSVVLSEVGWVVRVCSRLFGGGVVRYLPVLLPGCSGADATLGGLGVGGKLCGLSVFGFCVWFVLGWFCVWSGLCCCGFWWCW